MLVTEVNEGQIDTGDQGKKDYMVRIQNAGQAGQIHHDNRAIVSLYVKTKQSIPYFTPDIIKKYEGHKSNGKHDPFPLKEKQYLLFGGYQDVC